MKKYLIVSATSFEIDPLLDFLDKNAQKENFFSYIYKDKQITPLVTGVGALFTAFSMATYLKINEMDLVINVGLAGSFRPSIERGSVINVITDRFADLGVEEANGSFTDVFELELHDSGKFPFRNGVINNEKVQDILPTDIQQVQGITVNTVHGTADRIALIQEKYDPDVESMEGAGFMYACNMLQLKGIQIRSISNYVEPRNKHNWEIELAINNLNKYLIDYLS